MKAIASNLLLGFALFAHEASARDPTVLPRDSAKEAWVRTVLGRLGLSNDIRVVRDDSLAGSGTCAYASIRGGIQWVAYDPGCATSLTPGDENYWWSAGVMLHEIAHHLAAHTAAPGSRAAIEHEIEAERWVGWAFRHNGAGLNGALAYAGQGPVNASLTHPGRAERLRAVEQGWREADMSARVKDQQPTNADKNANNDARLRTLADSARRALELLRSKQ